MNAQTSPTDDLKESMGPEAWTRPTLKTLNARRLDETHMGLEKDLEAPTLETRITRAGITKHLSWWVWSTSPSPPLPVQLHPHGVEHKLSSLAISPSQPQEFSTFSSTARLTEASWLRKFFRAWPQDRKILVARSISFRLNFLPL